MSQKGKGSGDFTLEYQYLMGDMHHGARPEEPLQFQTNNSENLLIIILSFGTLMCLIAVCGGLLYTFRHSLAGAPDDFELSRREAAKR